MKQILIITTVILFLVQPLWAITGQELKTMLDQDNSITLVDIRNNAQYKEGHIQGAINIPSSVIPMKRLPGLGEIVIYGDGIRTDITQNALTAINEKPGIQARMLEGGYAAWQSLNLPTTGSMGITRKQVHHVTYSNFEKMMSANPNITLLDLRPPSGSLTNLSELFPGVRVLQFKNGIKKKASLDPAQLYILIDDGSGISEKTAARLHVSGFRRLAVLTGGELSVSRKGKSGLQTKTITGQFTKGQQQ